MSTGIGAGGEKAVGKLPRHVAKSGWNATAMAADLTVVEDHRQRVGKDADHGQHDEGTVLMGGGRSVDPEALLPPRSRALGPPRCPRLIPATTRTRER